MKFVLAKNTQVIAGPNEWRKNRFEDILKRSLDITVTLPYDNEQFMEITPEVKFYPATVTEISLNSKIQQPAGPFWTFTADTASGTYTAADKEISAVKGELKQKITEDRYKKEVAGVKVTIQGLEVSVDTSRDGRHIFVQQYLLMADNATTLWKFPEGWLTLTKSDLGIAVTAGAAHIQAQFNAEAAKIAEIEACTTLAQLDAVEMPSELPLI